MATLDELLGESAPMVELRRRVQNLLRKVAGLRDLPPMLIQGETGTGKTTLARLIHRSSARAAGPFVDINCAEFHESLLESELFGHERYTFTGAGPGKAGLFQAAHRGVLFLDEIGEMSPALQAKLLKVLDTGATEVRRVGSTRREGVDVAVIAATHSDLRAAMKDRRFREDLYNRIAGLTLEIPPLRARGDDVVLLAGHLLERACQQYGLPAKTLADDACDVLRHHTWPGNVRELGNVMRRVALESESTTVTARELGRLIDRAAPARAEPEDDGRERLVAALTRTRWNITRTARELGVTRNTVKERIKRYGLRSPAAPSTRAAAPAETEAAEAPAAPSAAEAPAAAVAIAPGARTAPATGVRWMRRRVTLLRVRVRGEVAAPLSVTTPVLQDAIEHARSFGGRIESVSPQAVVAVFGLDPDEDAPRRAALAAFAIVKTLERAGGEHESGAPPVGLALHVTQILLADVGGALSLDEDGKREAWAVLEALLTATGEGIALSETAVQFLARRFDVQHEGSGAVAGWLVGRVPSDLKFSPSEFLGRERELGLLEGCLERAVDGHGQLVAIVGEPGIGKSRLVHELLQRTPPDTVAVLRGRCLSYAASAPYHLALDVLRNACGIQDTDGPAAIDAKAQGLLNDLDAAEAPWAPYVVNLLSPGRSPVAAGAAPELVRERTFEALQHLVLLQQERKPLVLVIEDVHWIDETSHDLLGVLADAVVRRRILVLCTSRPGYQFPWAGRSHASQVALLPLPTEASRRLVVANLAGQTVGPEVVSAILNRGEGNPFFLEELVRAVRGGDAGTDASIPATVHDVLSARILRLPHDDRQILQLAAVIGRDVPVALLEAVSEAPPAQTRASLARLSVAELLYPARVGGDAAYTFSHALTWDVANELMLEDERRALHARVVSGIEQRYASRLLDHVERLAEHAERGGLWPRAIVYNRQAGHKAVSHSAYRDAVAFFTRALFALEHTPHGTATLEDAVDIRFELRSALLPLGDFAQIFKLLSELESLTEHLGDPRRQGLVAALMTGACFSMGDSRQAARYGERACEIAAACGDLAVDVLANSYLANAYYFLGEYARSIGCAQHVVDTLPRDRSHESFGVAIRPAVYARGVLSWSLAETGRFVEAEAAARDAVELADVIGHPSTVAAGLITIGTFHVRRGDLEDSVAPFERAHDLCQRRDIPLWRPTVASFLGYSLTLCGRSAEGEALIRGALDAAVLMRLSVFSSQMTLWLGEARLLAGAVDEAERLAADALDATRERHEGGVEAWALRLLAEIVAHRTPLDLPRAESLYRQAMQRADERGMRPLSARCHLGLGTLYRQAGRRDEAREHLSAAEHLFADMGMRRWLDCARAQRALD